MPDGQSTTTPPESGTVQAIRFLKAIFQPEDLILFRPIEVYIEGGKKRAKVDADGIRYDRFGGRAGDAEWLWHDSRMEVAVQQIIARANTTLCNIFFGVCPRLGNNQQYDQAWQIRTVRTLWADIDDATPDEAVDRCKASGVPLPSIVIGSGNGTHLYWLLEQAAVIDDACRPPPVHSEWIDRGEGKSKQRKLYLLDPHTKEKLSLDARQNVPLLSDRAQRIQDAIAGIAAKVGGDHTIDLSRILRLPGTLNRKDQRNGRAPTECRLVHLDTDCRYSLSTLLAFSENSPSRVKRAKVQQVPLPPKKRMNASRQDRMNSLIASCAAAEIGARSEVDFSLCCYAVECGQDPEEIWQAASGVGKFAEEGKRYFDLTWEAAKLHTRERLFSKAAKKEKRKADKKESAESEPAAELSNGAKDEEDEESPVVPLEIRSIITAILERTSNWPRRIGSALFAHEPGRRIDMLDSPAALFGWLGARAGVIHWYRGPGFATKEEVYCELCRTATAYQAVEYLPHHPPIPDHYYACEFPAPGNGETITQLLNRFSPATVVDRRLILLMFATPFWGGRGGTRPGFIVTSEGRGTGKSKLSELASRLAGGYIEVREYEDAALMRQRLLSDEALQKRIARLDNVKSLRFSWSDLESTMTAEILSGKRMYYGETSRPNTLTWFLTLNGISLSTDLAQRTVIVQLARPRHDGDWENETVAFIEKNRQALIGDILGFLRLEEAAPLPKHSRWGPWEASLLCKFPDAEQIQRVITERQREADTEFEEASDIEEHFRKNLESLGYEAAVQKIHIPCEIAAAWYREASNEKNLKNTACSKILHQFCQEGRIERLKPNPSRKYGRGFLWNFDLDADSDYDLQDRIDARKKESREQKEENRFWDR